MPPPPPILSRTKRDHCSFDAAFVFTMKVIKILKLFISIIWQISPSLLWSQ